MHYKDWSGLNQSILTMAAGSVAPVLILGETGTGKSVMAKTIHDFSDRKANAFVNVNLATLYEGTLESELFGHEKGAFTGADQKRVGRLELAHNGTLFLDEIGELPLKLQARLLEVLQTGKIIPIGSNKETCLNIRVIAATNRDLSKMIQSGLFREDLFHRLSVIQMSVPSLVDFRLEFDQIFHYILAELGNKIKKVILKIDESVAEILENYSWPGNFRELSNVLEYAVMSSKNGEITVADLPMFFLEKQAAQFLSKSLEIEDHELTDKKTAQTSEVLGFVTLPVRTDFYENIRFFEKHYFEILLKHFRGKINLTAKRSGLSKSTLLSRLKNYGIHRKSFN